MAPAKHPKKPAKDNHSYLGALAPELLDNILLEIDSVRALGNFITTSRFVHRHFEKRKEPIVFRVIQNELGPVVTDARFLRVFPYTKPGGSWEDCIAYWDRIHTGAAL